MSDRVKFVKLIRAHTLMRAVQSMIGEAYAHLVDQPDLAKISQALDKALDAASEAKAYMGDVLEPLRDTKL